MKATNPGLGLCPGLALRNRSREMIKAILIRATATPKAPTPTTLGGSSRERHSLRTHR